jgi:hypothetical protein
VLARTKAEYHGWQRLQRYVPRIAGYYLNRQYCQSFSCLAWWYASGRMSQEPKANGHRHKPVSQSDLIDLILEPLASQVDRARLEIVEKLQSIDDSIEIIARQEARQADLGQ